MSSLKVIQIKIIFDKNMLEKVKNHLQNYISFLNNCRENNLKEVSSALMNKAFSEEDVKKLEEGYKTACNNGSLDVIQYLMTSNEFSPNMRSVRGIDYIFNKKHESVIQWLIFEFNMRKSDAVEEVLIEMGDKTYAKYIEGLFEKRELAKSLAKELENKDSVNKPKV